MKFSRIAPRLAVFGAALTMLFVALQPGPATGATGFNWSTWGYDNQRTGFNPAETTLTTANVGTLTTKWSFTLGQPTIGQPLYAEGVTISGTPTNVLYVVSEDGKLYALNADTGAQIWVRSWGTRTTTCTQNFQNGKAGITSTPVFDRPTNRIYVVPVDGKMYALNMSTGATISGWPVTLTGSPSNEYVWSAPTLRMLATDGTVSGYIYVPMASYCDQGSFHGRIIRINVSSRGVLLYRITSGTVNGGTIWSYGGVSLNASTADVFGASDESRPGAENQQHAQRLLRWSSGLTLEAQNYPSIPNSADHSFGSTPMLFQAPGCPAEFVIESSTGMLLLVKQNFTNTSGVVQKIRIATNQIKYRLIGNSAYDPTNNIIVAPTSSSGGGYTRGLVAFQPNNAVTNCPLVAKWTAPNSVGGSAGWTSEPTIANGVVYYGNGAGKQLLAYNVVDGTPLATVTLDGGIWGTPTVANGKVYVGTWNFVTPNQSKIYALGLP